MDYGLSNIHFVEICSVFYSSSSRRDLCGGRLTQFKPDQFNNEIRHKLGSSEDFCKENIRFKTERKERIMRKRRFIATITLVRTRAKTFHRFSAALEVNG